ncbi:RNA methyltransferase, partial [Bacillus thuringiensis]|nr:RNA methyltransferase [Bacillus thuringiensis]
TATSKEWLPIYAAAIGAPKPKVQYGLKKSPLDLLEKSWHHQNDYAIFKGDYADANIIDPLFPRLPTYDSFYDAETTQLVEDIFKTDFTIYKY